MKRRIEQLINGRFEYEVPKLLLSQTEITDHTKVGENYRGDLHLSAEEGRKIKGMAASSHRRFILGKERFQGNAIHIPYGVDVKGLHAGDICQGTIVLTTNLGEYQIPFCITIEEKQVKTSGGAIQDMDEFVELAKTDYREAFRLYVDEAFYSLLKDGEESWQTYYQGMSQNPVTYQHLEEFLIGIGKKESISLHIQQEEIELYDIQSSLQDSVEIKRDGWGYLRAEVSVQGDFLEVEKKVITSEDFIGSVYQLEYIIRRESLENGRNFARIKVKTVYETLYCEIVASKKNRIQVNTLSYEKKMKVELSRNYLSLCTHRMNYRNWYQESVQLLKKLKETSYEEPAYLLFEAYVYYTAEENEKTMEILEQLDGKVSVQENPELEGFYLYLNQMTKRMPRGQSDFVEKIRSLFHMQPESFWLLWILLREDEELQRTPAKKLYVLEQQYEIGCRSPFLYFEAFQVIKKDGGLLRKINNFYAQVLYFAKKQGLLTEELALRVVYLSAYVKNFSKFLYEMLVDIYEQHPSREILDAICKLIIKGNPRKPEYFRWYELAVEQELRITRLYEYYIETMGRNYQKALPQVIRMYFSYNNTLSDKKKAFIYANVIRNQDGDKNTYQSYKSAMTEFAREKLQEGKMNEDFAVLYQEFCMNPKTAAEREGLAKVLCTYRLYCDDTKVRQVVVCHHELAKEQRYPCIDGVAYLHIYTPNAKIIFEDDKRRRYISTVDYNLSNLMEMRELQKTFLSGAQLPFGLLLHICQSETSELIITKENLVCYQEIVANEAFSPSYQQEVRQKLLEYYCSHRENENLKDYLQQIDFREFAKINKSLLIEILIAQGMYVGAYDLLSEYGYEGVKNPDLLRLCSRMIINLEFAYDEELLLLAHYVFDQGIYDETILHYLCNLYEGPIRDMIRIWEAAQGFQMQVYDLEEKILSYCMFARVYLLEGAEVLKSYSKQGGKEQIMLAYLAYESYGYFMEGNKVNPFIFDSIEKAVKKNWEVDDVCYLALLQYDARQKELNEMQGELCKMLLEECSKKGLRFAFFQQLPKEYLRSYQLEDKVFVEHKANPKAKVTLYYHLGELGDEKEKEYRSEPMKHKYQGIFQKEFVLFYGEELTYYIMTQLGDNVQKTELKTITMEQVEVEGNTKYQKINQMLAAEKVGNKELLQKLIQQYQKQEQLINRIFQIAD